MIFEIVNQLNRKGNILMTDLEELEREQLAELNLMAGNRAKAATAYDLALRYLNAGAASTTARLLGAPAPACLRD